MIRAIIVNFYPVLNVRAQKEIKMNISKATSKRKEEIATEQKQKTAILERYGLVEEDLKKPVDYSTLKGFIIEGVRLYINYGEGSPALALAIGRLFDNHCRR